MDKTGMFLLLIEVVHWRTEREESQLVNGLGQGCWTQVVNSGLAIAQRVSRI